MAFLTPEQKGISKEEVEKINEELWQEALQEIRHCPDCGVKSNEFHLVNCDVARCGNCGGQLFSCDCDNPTNTKWSGLWPGYKECYENKLICYDDGHGIYAPSWRFDLNELAIKQANNEI